jgi:hypothetical protein
VSDDTQGGVYAIGPDGKHYVFPKGTSPEQVNAHFHPPATIGAAPSPTSGAGAKRTGYTYLEKGLEFLPMAGGIAGAIAGAPSGPGAVAGAGLGGAAGEAGRQLIRRAVGWSAPPTSGQAATDIAKEGASQAAAEATGQVGSRALKPIGEAMSKTAIRGSRVPLLPSEAGVGGSGTKRLEAFTSHFLPSAPIMTAFRERQTQAAEDVIEQEIKRISPFRGTAEQAYELTQNAVKQGRQSLKKDVNAAYKAVDQLTQGRVQPDIRNVKAVADKLLKEIQQQKVLMDPELLKDSERMLEQIKSAPDQVPYQAVADSRSDLLSLGRKLDEALPGKRAGMAKLLAEEMDKSMMTAAQKSGISGLETQVRVANSLNREMHRKFEQKLMTSILDSKNPELLAGYLQKAGLSEIRDFNSLLTKPQQRLMQSQIVREALRDTSGKMRPPMEFAQHFNKIGESRAKEIFGANYAPLKKLADTLGKIGDEKKGGMAAMFHNYQYLFSSLGAPLALATGHPLGAAAIAGKMGIETVATRKLARVLTNPAKAARTVDLIQRGLHGAPYAVYGLGKLVTMEDDPEQEYPVPAIPRPPDPIAQQQ